MERLSITESAESKIELSGGATKRRRNGQPMPLSRNKRAEPHGVDHDGASFAGITFAVLWLDALHPVNTRQQQITGTGDIRADDRLDVLARRNHDVICDLVRSERGRRSAAANDKADKPKKEEATIWHRQRV